MKAVGDFVIVEIEQTKSASGIVSMHRNEGKCISCSRNKSLEGKRILYSSKGRYEEYNNLMFIPYESVLAVLE